MSAVWIVPTYIDRCVSSSFGINEWRTVKIKQLEEGTVAIRVRLKITKELYDFHFSSRKTLLKMEKCSMKQIYNMDLRNSPPLTLPELPEKIARPMKNSHTPRSALIAVSREMSSSGDVEKFKDNFGYSE